MRWALFVYGSLVDTGTLAEYIGRPLVEGTDYTYARLQGHRRSWGVATDNATGKAAVVYFTPDHAVVPAVQVLFLDVEEGPGASVDGLLVMVDSDVLDRLRRREGNYEAVDVTGRCVSAVMLSGGAPDRIVTFCGRELTRKAAAHGLAAGTACIRGEYLRTVEAAMAQHGWKDAFRAEPLPAPVRELLRERRSSVGGGD
jgi:hypothetical protein